MAEMTPEMFGQSGSKAFFNADSKPGTTITGTVDAVEVYQAKDFQTGELQVSKSGKPKYDMRIDLVDTNAPREDEYDDGSRSIYIHGWGVQSDAYRKALRQVGVGYKVPQQGDTMTATYVGLGKPVARGLSAPKMYEYKFVKAQPTIAPDSPFSPDYGQQTQTQAPAAQPVAQPMQPAQVAQAVQVPVEKIRQLAAVGVDQAEIARITNTTIQQIQNILADEEPEF